MRSRIGVAALLAACIAAVVSLGCGSKPSSGGAKEIRIAIVPKGSTHEHWKRVRIGAEKAAAEFTAAGTPRRGDLEGADA